MADVWNNCHAGVPGYATMTYGKWLDEIRRLAHRTTVGELGMLAYYLALLEKHGALAGMANAAQERADETPATLPSRSARSFPESGKHSRDEDCTVDAAVDMCTGCGVAHGDPCPECGGRGFHREGCSESEATGAAIPAYRPESEPTPALLPPNHRRP